jgi:hypothetical protein
LVDHVDVETTQVLIAIELRSYREAIAQAMRSLRPDVEVYETEPEGLNREVTRLRPDLVLCSQVTPVVESRIPIWIELYPTCEGPSVVSIRGETSTVQEIQLADLLALLDQARGLPVPV